MNKPKDNENTHCADCGVELIQPPNTGASGYAILPNGNRICYSCADKREVEELKDRSRPFVAYLQGCEVQTWTGGKLMTVTRSRPCQLTRFSFTHDRNGYRSIHAVDVHGGHWTGRGSDGIAIRMRPCKG